MSLNPPHLDDRSFQDIVDDVKRQIGRRCPEWTDHNVSDPGVTLIELFAWMMEMSLYRLNQVPDKNYLKFLEMIGIGLEPPMPAQTELRFRLTRPIEDRPGEEKNAITLYAGRTAAATLRTETEEATEFCTDSDLRMVRPCLRYVLALPSESAGSGVGVSAAQVPRDFMAWQPGKTRPPAQSRVIREELGEGEEGQVADLTTGFPIFSPRPRQGDALYLGFEADISGNLVQLEAECDQTAPTGLNESYPSQYWEFWNGKEGRWDPLENPMDTTFGFNRPPGQRVQGEPTGRIELAMPTDLQPTQVRGIKAFWVRCVYSIEEKRLPPRGPEGLRPSTYTASPEIWDLTARVVGGSAASSNSVQVSMKELGQSDGTSGQVFFLGKAPILPLRREDQPGPQETVLIGKEGAPLSNMEVWKLVPDFAESGPEDRHFTCDTFTGQIAFGPEIRQPDGTTRQYGRIPDKGMNIVFSAYRFGGGLRGNVASDKITVLKSSLPYIASVTNPRRADGGREQETLERAKMRGREVIRLRDRAVTAEDYEVLAGRASSTVGRARCIQPRGFQTKVPQDELADYLTQRDYDEKRVGRGRVLAPGETLVLLIPALDASVTLPTLEDLKVTDRTWSEVSEYLEERRLLTSILRLEMPKYVFVSTEITLIADPKADPDTVQRSVRERLEHYIHPLYGGPNGDGWPFERNLTLSDIYAQVQLARGVAFLRDVKIYFSRVLETGNLSARKAVPLNVDSNSPDQIAQGVSLKKNEILCTLSHDIRVEPMWAAGA